MVNSQRRLVLTALFVAGLAMLLPNLGAAPALAQQGSFHPAPTLPTNRNQGESSTLEVPVTKHQPGETQAIPPIAPQQGQELTVAPHELRRQTGYEQVTVTVTNQHGGYETGLKRDDLRLYIDGSQRPIEFFRHDLNTPVSVGILVDTSGSMDVKIPQARTAIAEFVNRLNDRDDIFLFAFSDRPYLLQPFTTNHQALLARLKLLRAYGQTALFDTIIDGLLMVQHGRWDKKALLVVTDGMDNQSQSDVAQIVAHARRMGVLVYSIGIGEPNAVTPASGFGPFIFGSSEEVDAATLNTLSTETGARTFVVRQVGDGAALAADCQTIAEELQEQYTVGFVAPDAGRGGYRNIRVEVPKHPEDTVRVRKGVTVGSGTESASSGSVPIP